MSNYFVMKFCFGKTLCFLAVTILIIGCRQNKNGNEFNEVTEEEYLPKFQNPSISWLNIYSPKIDSFFNKYFDSAYFSGQFVVAKNGFVCYENYHGYANYEKRESIGFSTPLHVASVSKVATALAILRLCQNRKLGLDHNVRKYLKTFPFQGITIRMLLNHRSGLPYYAYFSEGIWDQSKLLTNKDILVLLSKYNIPLNFRPNTHFAYSNTNYVLLALIIEEVTKKAFPSAMNDLVFKPLKMNSSFILSDSALFTKVSQSYSSRCRNQGFNYLDAVYGDKNMYSTARDIVKLDLATYGDKFISKPLKKEMFKGYSYENKGKKNYGLGIRIIEEDEKETYFFHSGWWHGNTAMYSSLRADTICMVVISNRYTKSVYNVNRLAKKFGNYPFNYPED